MSAIEWLEILPKPGQGAPEECRLGIHKADDTTLVVGIPKAGGNWTEREYFLKENKFIPQYPFERTHLDASDPDSDPGWRITVIGRPGLSDRVDKHVFRNREAALEFQKYVTGYVVVAHCENVSWDSTVRVRGFLLQDRKFKAEGEIQLWQPIQPYEPRRSSRVGTSSSTPDPTLHPLFRTQTGESSTSTRAPAIPQENGTAHFNIDRSPLLVAFVRDGTKYNMIKIHIERDGLPFRRDLLYQTGLMEFQSDKGFKLERLEGEENSTDNRDVCAFARNSKTAAKNMIKETLTCLKIIAPDMDQHQFNIFRNELDRVRQGYHIRELEQRQIRVAIDQRKPPGAGSSPASSRRSSSIPFLPLEVDRSRAFPSTPSIQELLGDPVTATTRHELSPDYIAALTRYASTSPPIDATETGFARTSPPTATSPRTPTGRPLSRQTTRSGFSIIRRSASTATRPEEPRGRRPAAPSFISTPPSESSSSHTMSTDTTNEVFADLDSDIRRFMSSTPGLGSADEAIRTLHSLPGGPRALLYQFGSIPSSSDGEPGRQRRRFRCPFDIVYPHNGVDTGCQGPGFYPLDRLWRHLERHHSSFDCHNCLRDFHDYDGIEAHMLQGCRDRSTSLPSRIPFALFLRVERTLVPQGSTTTTGLGILAEENDDVMERKEIERWNRMWDVLFPSLGKDAVRRPSPFLEAPSISHDANLARLEMIFAAMVENDTACSSSNSLGSVRGGGTVQDGNGMITKTKAKRYLRAAIQALMGEELDSWETLLTSAELGVGNGSGSASPGSVQVGWTNGASTGLRNGNGDARLGSVGTDFLRLMGASRAEGG